MSWQSKINWELAKERSRYIQLIRQFFYERNVVEVETPLLSSFTVTEANIESFECKYKYFNTDELLRSDFLYLQTSPEYAMKRLIASGYGSIFQLCKAFRHEEHGRHHNPEFTLLEWYRIGFDHFELMAEVDQLLQVVLGCESADKFTYQELFIQHLQIDPLCCSIHELKELLLIENIIGDWIEEEKDIDVLLQVLFSESIEPKLGLTRPCFIYDYPKSQASLAKISNRDPRVAERFECYFKGVELANGFNELTDADEQFNRFKIDNEKRLILGKEEKLIDQNFIDALKNGLQQCSGVALGIDRLMMLALAKKDIASTMTFNITNA